MSGSHWRVRLTGAALFLLAGGAIPCAQQTPQPEFRISVDLVQLQAVVTDSKGRHVTDLKPEDFEIRVDGKPQPVVGCRYIRITSPGVAPAEKAPASPGKPGLAVGPAKELQRDEVQRTIVFLVDDGSLKPEVVLSVRKALKAIIERKVQPGDLVAVIRTMSGEGSLEQSTADKSLLSAAVDRVRWVPMGRGAPHMDMDDPTATYVRMASSFKANQTFLNVLARLQALPGKKALVFISQDWSGDDTLSFKGIGFSYRNYQIPSYTGEMVDHAVRAGVTIYTVDPIALDSLDPGAEYDLTQDYSAKYGIGRGEGAGAVPSPMAPQLIRDYRSRAFYFLELSRTGLRTLAQKTGGLMVADSNDISWGMAKFLDDQQGYYQLEFKPQQPEQFYAPKGNPLSPFHNVRIKVRRPGLQTRYHAGFIGKDEKPPDTTVATIQQALESPFSAPDLPVRLRASFDRPLPGVLNIDVMLHLAASDIAWSDGVEGRRHGQLELVARTIDDTGKPAESVRKEIDLQLLPGTFQQAQRKGLSYRASIPVAKPGYYEVRIVVRDVATGKMGSARQYVDVPDTKKGPLALSGLLTYNPAVAPIQDQEFGVAELGRFERGDQLEYACLVFNSRTQGQAPMESQVRLFRDGKPVLDLPPAIVKSGPAAPDRALMATGSLPLKSLEPGDYVLQLAVRDPATKDIASQWGEFTVLP
jgi:VWFA-related protein